MTSNIRGFINLIDINDLEKKDNNVVSFKIHDNAIYCIKMSERYNGFFSGDKSGIIKFSEITLNSEIKEKAFSISKNNEGVRGLSLSPSEGKLVSCHEDKKLRIWDISNFSEEQSLEGHGSDVMAVDWHPTKAFIASGSKDRLLKFWDPISNKNIGSLFNHTNTINTIKFNKNGNFMLSAGKDQILRILDLRMMKEVFQLNGHDSEVLYADWHPIYSNQLISTDVEGKICYWVLPSNLPTDVQFHSEGNIIRQCAFDEYGDFFASLCHDKSIKLWDIKEFKRDLI